jgi:hypothetical protein
MEALLLIGLAILGEQFHRSREPALIFPEDIGGRISIANMFGRFKRRLCALLTPGKPTVGKFLQASSAVSWFCQKRTPIGA